MEDRALWYRFLDVAEQDPAALAVDDVTNGITLTYGTFKEQAEALAKTLSALPAQFIAYIGEPDGAALPLVFAAACAGKTFVPISDLEHKNRLKHILASLGDTIVVSASGDNLPSGPEQSHDVLDLGLKGITTQVMKNPDFSHPPGLPYLITYTSGSTGLPKAIAISQGVKLKRTLQSIELFAISAEDRVLSVSPLHHSLGQRLLFVSLLSGATYVKAHPFVPEKWIRAARDHGCTVVIAVSTHLKLLLPALSAQPDILAGLRVIVSSSAPAEAGFKTKVLDQSSFEFWEIYGLSEAACATAVRYRKGANTAHVGEALPGVKLRIHDGEIQLKSEYLCNGYFGDLQRWHDAFTGDGWFRSGDLGRLDDNGQLYYLGRKGESFQSAGLLVFPAEIEAVLQGCPGVLDCVVFGFPNPVFENLVGLAYLPSSDDITDRDVLAFARRELPKQSVPAKIRKFARFPTLTSGKIARARIAQQCLDALGPSSEVVGDTQ